MDEHVLRGNTGILKCHIPSFVSDFVFVSSWIETDGTEYFTQTDKNFQTGIYLAYTHRKFVSFYPMKIFNNKLNYFLKRSFESSTDFFLYTSNFNV